MDGRTEHWTVPFVVPEVLATAFDEATMTETAEPVISHERDWAWHVCDFGRGLRYAHLRRTRA